MSEELDMMWSKITAELDMLKAVDDDLRMKTEKAGEAFSFPISTLANAPLAAQGMNTYAARFISDWDLPTWYHPSSNAYRRFGDMAELVRYTVLSGSAATIDIQNIPATFHVLLLLHELRTDAGATGDQYRIRYNNDSGANYYYAGTNIAHSATLTTIEGIAATAINNFCIGNTATANRFALGEIVIPRYARTGHHRVCYIVGGRNFGNTTGDINVHSGTGLWQNTADAISRITLLPNTGTNFVAGSAYALYGLGRAA